MRELIIDTDFLNLTVPNTEEEQIRFEESIMSEGCLKPIIVWNDVIIDGHKRYILCRDEEIDFEVLEIDFPSRERAIAWVCEKRLKNLSPGTPAYKYLFGKRVTALRPYYRELCKSELGDYQRETSGNFRLSKIMAEDLGIEFYTTVESTSSYAYYIDKISRIDPEIFRGILSGSIKATVNEIKLFAKGDPKTRKTLRDRMFPKNEAYTREVRVNKEDNRSLSTKIKEMPTFDPDMSIKGLTLTIPTWMAAIARAEEKTDMEQATDFAKRQLTESLMRLEEQIHQMLAAIQQPHLTDSTDKESIQY